MDSTSTDGSLEYYETLKTNYNIKIHVQENKGKAAARNVGVKLSRGSYIIITDGDMIPEPDFVQAHLNAHEASEKLQCFEGLAYNLDKLEWPIKTAELFPQVGKNPKHLSKLGWYYFLTGNLSIPKSLFDELGGFNEEFKGYGWEDLELGYRLSLKKVPLKYLKTAVNYHYHVISEEEEIERNINKGRSSKLFIKLHPKLKLFLGLNPVSLYIYSKINPDGAFINLMKNNWFRSNNKFKKNFSFWFLKEYNYLSGLLEN